jgi:hypothetical protein
MSGHYVLLFKSLHMKKVLILQNKSKVQVTIIVQLDSKSKYAVVTQINAKLNYINESYYPYNACYVLSFSAVLFVLLFKIHK